MLRAAELKMIILVDGFIMTNCVLVASRLYPEMQSYCVFGHCGDEAGHKRILDFLGAKALLDLGLRLGEGSGSVCAYPILDSAVRMINEMYSFKQAAITKYLICCGYSLRLYSLLGYRSGGWRRFRRPVSRIS